MITKEQPESAGNLSSSRQKTLRLPAEPPTQTIGNVLATSAPVAAVKEPKGKTAAAPKEGMAGKPPPFLCLLRLSAHRRGHTRRGRCFNGLSRHDQLYSPVLLPACRCVVGRHGRGLAKTFSSDRSRGNTLPNQEFGNRRSAALRQS